MSIGNKLTVAKNVVTSKAGRQLLKGQKHSPTILFGAGVIGVVATAVVASKATLHLEDILEHAEDNRAKAAALHESHPEQYTEKKYSKDLKTIKTQLIVSISKEYAPAVALGVLSIAALTGSHVILSRRNAGLMAAYATLEKGFNEYRRRVVNEYGEDKDRELRFGLVDRDIETADGETKSIKASSGISEYARIFSRDTSNSWDPRPDHNLVFLKSVQVWCNDQLHGRGHVFLNDVFDSLGMDRTQAGSVVGWIRDEKYGDNFVDFGIFEDSNPMSFHEFFNHPDGAIMLDFNVNGVIWDKI